MFRLHHKLLNYKNDWEILSVSKEKTVNRHQPWGNRDQNLKAAVITIRNKSEYSYKGKIKSLGKELEGRTLKYNRKELLE